MDAGYNTFIWFMIALHIYGHAVTVLHVRGGRLDGVSESYDLGR